MRRSPAGNTTGTVRVIKNGKQTPTVVGVGLRGDSFTRDHERAHCRREDRGVHEYRELHRRRGPAPGPAGTAPGTEVPQGGGIGGGLGGGLGGGGVGPPGGR